MSKDPLGDKMKAIESRETMRRGAVGKPIYIRIDGNNFSRLTKGMRKPFDTRMANAMESTTRDLMELFGAKIGYTQSDEISLVLHNSDYEVAYGGKFQKLVSRTASAATALFTFHATSFGLGDFIRYPKMAQFDSRAFEFDTISEAENCIFWRIKDAKKNSVQSVAREYLSHKEVQNVSSRDLEKILGETYTAYHPRFRFGTYFYVEKETRLLTEEELSAIPANHRPDGPVTRNAIRKVHINV